MRLSWRKAFGMTSQDRDNSSLKTLGEVSNSGMKPAFYTSLTDQVVLVTGGASGIGEEIVRSFAGQGARVGFIDVQTERGARLQDELQGLGQSAMFLSCDLKNIDALEASADHLARAFGRVTVLVNNAADDDRHDWMEITPAYFDERVATNLRHYFFAIQLVAPGMIAAGKGSIINLGSIAALEGGKGLALYSAAKAAVHGLTRSFARELGKHRIRVNTVVPGWVMTERQKQLWMTPDALKHHLQRQCLPDPVQPVHVARLVLFLASDESLMCTAGLYNVEGGL